MTDTTYQAPNLTLEAQNVLTALQDLALATRRLIVAAFFKMAQVRQPDPFVLGQVPRRVLLLAGGAADSSERRNTERKRRLRWDAVG